MADLEELVVTIDAKIDGLVEGMKDAENATDEGVESMRDDLKKLTADFRETTDATVKWGIATTLAAAAAAAAIVTATSEQVAALDRASQRLGVNIEVLSAYAQVAKEAGLDQEQFVDGLQQLNIQIADFVQTGGGGAFDLITQLGVDARALNELRPDQQLLALAEAIKDVPESAALKFLDDIGSDALAALLPLLKDGGQAFADMAQEALDAGRVIREDDVRAIELMNAELKKSQGEIEAVASEFTGTLAPFIIVAFDELKKLTGEGAEFEDVIAGAFGVAARVIGIFSDGLQGVEIIFKVLQTGVAAFVASMTQGLVGADQALTEFLNAVTPDALKVFETSDVLAGFAVQTLVQAGELKQDLDALLAEPLSSEAVDAFGKEILAKVQQIRSDIDAELAEDGEPIVIPVVPEIAAGLDTLDTEDVRFFSDEMIKEAVVQLGLLNKEFADSKRTQLDLLTEDFEKENDLLVEARARDKITEEGFLTAKAAIEQRFADQRIDLAMTERDRLIEDRELELEQQQQFLDQKLINEEEFLRRKAVIEKKFQADNIKLAQDEAKAKSFFGKQATVNAIAGIESLGKISDKAAKAAFRINQAKALSDAIVSTAAGIQRAFADLPFPAALAAAAAVAASGVAQIATITSQSFGGGGSPSAPGGAAPAAATPAPTAAEVAQVEATVSVTGGEGVSLQTIFVNVGGGEFGDALVDELNRAVKDGRGQETPVIGRDVL